MITLVKAIHRSFVQHTSTRIVLLYSHNYEAKKSVLQIEEYGFYIFLPRSKGI